MWSECLVYLDDIFVFGADFTTTLEHLVLVLDCLTEAGLNLKARKCLLFQEEIPFLGHVVSARGIVADPAKCQQVRTLPVPRDLHEVRFLSDGAPTTGGTSKGSLSWPTHSMSWPQRVFKWTALRDEAIEKLKAALTSAPILGIPNEHGQVGTGAVFSQMQD